MKPHPGQQEHPPDFPRRLDILKGGLQHGNFEGVIKFDSALYAIV